MCGCGHTGEDHAQIVRDLIAKHKIDLNEDTALERAVAIGAWAHGTETESIRRSPG